MTKKAEKNDEKVNAQTEQTSETTVSPEQAQIQVLKAELGNLQEAYAVQTEELAQIQSEKQDLLAQIAALKNAKQPETASDTRESILARSASGREFWRGGVLFDGDWREVKRGEVGETAWQRITSEPALQIKQAT